MFNWKTETTKKCRKLHNIQPSLSSLHNFVLCQHTKKPLKTLDVLMVSPLKYKQSNQSVVSETKHSSSHIMMKEKKVTGKRRNIIHSL